MFLEPSPLAAFIDWLQRTTFTTDRRQDPSDLPMESSALSTNFPLKGKVLGLLATFKSHKIRPTANTLQFIFPKEMPFFFFSKWDADFLVYNKALSGSELP